MLPEIAMRAEKRNRLHSLAILIILGALGGSISVPIGWAGNFLSSLAVFPLPQLLSGLHVFWLVLAALLVPIRGSATFTGALKGLIEASLFSHLGMFVFVVSLVEGAVVDLALFLVKKRNAAAVYVTGGVSSASNLLIVQLFFLPGVPPEVLGLAYAAAFSSGALFGGYFAMRVMKAMPSGFKATVKNGK